MYHQQHFNLIYNEQEDVESQPSYTKILEWSLTKLTVRSAGGSRRSGASLDLRRGVLIAATVAKARAGILRQRAMQFLEARPQLLPPSGWHGHCTVRGTQEQLPSQPQPESAFGYSASATDQDQDDDDALSVSADAIVMSSVELSIEDLLADEEDSSMTQEPADADSADKVQATSRKRKPDPTIKKPEKVQQPSPKQQQQMPQPQHPPSKRTKQLISTSGVAEPESLRNLQASFYGLSMSPLQGGGGACRQQAGHYGGSPVPWLLVSPVPECHSFA